jgi:hypothetical protein
MAELAGFIGLDMKTASCTPPNDRVPKWSTLFVIIGISLILAFTTATAHVPKDDDDILKGMLLFWKFDGSHGELVPDSSGSGNAGRLPVPVTFVDGTHGFALELDGIKTRVESCSGEGMKFTGREMTVSAWIYPGDDGGRILSKPWNGEGEYNYSIEYTDTHALRMILMEGVDKAWVSTASGTVPLNNWTHFAVRFSVSRMDIYLNGLLQISMKNPIVNWKPAKGDKNVPLTVGCLYPYPQPWPGNRSYCFRGLIRDFRLYDRTLDDSEIKTIYYRSHGNSAKVELALTNSGQSAALSGRATMQSVITGKTNAPFDKAVLQLDGTDTSTVVNDSPASFSWDTSEATNGIHLLNMRAADREGNQYFSEPVSVSVQNDALIPLKKTFPRIAAGHGVNQFFQRYVDVLSKADLAILNFDRGWHEGLLKERDILRAIKARNPNILLGQYTILNEAVIIGLKQSCNADINRKVSSERGPHRRGDWWARSANGQFLYVYPDARSINITDSVTPDSNGNRYSEWLAKREYSAHFHISPEFSIWYVDNVVHAPYLDADWGGEGISEAASDPGAQSRYRSGFRRYFDSIRKICPAVMLMGNAGDNGKDGFLGAREYKGQLEMAFYENVHEQPWETFLDGYRRLSGNTRFPHVVVVSMYGRDDDYALARYGLASTLLGDGYFNYGYDTLHCPSSRYTPVIWLDEFDLAGKGGTNWLGKAIDPPQSLPWQNGVYRRRFQNGTVLVNPKGNGEQTVYVQAGYSRFTGIQQPTVNNGKPASSLTLPDGSGLLLTRRPM